VARYAAPAPLALHRTRHALFLVRLLLFHLVPNIVSKLYEHEEDGSYQYREHHVPVLSNEEKVIRSPDQSIFESV
jgi:hypothetical protein